MTRVTFDISENIVKVVIINAVGVFKVTRFAFFSETFIVFFKHLFVFTVSVGTQGRYLIFGLHKFFMNNVLMFLACAFKLISHKVFLLAYQSLLDLLLPRVEPAFVAQQVVV